MHTQNRSHEVPSALQYCQEDRHAHSLHQRAADLIFGEAKPLTRACAEGMLRTAVCTIPATHRATDETAAAPGSEVIRDAVPMACAEAPIATPRDTSFTFPSRSSSCVRLAPFEAEAAGMPKALSKGGPKDAPYTPVRRMEATARAGLAPSCSAPAIPRADITDRCESMRPSWGGSCACPAAHAVPNKANKLDAPAPPTRGFQFSSSTLLESNMRKPRADTAAFINAATKSPAPPFTGPWPFT
mmetsp:Transcript_81324/g.162252  ORF Transcript_81324/g.162252 Transcript_81324/m.162252 type:complete len:243 (+) Transcript_81324:332-1060(+)